MDDNPFARFHALGFARLIPIVPPGAEVSPHSTLHKRIGTPQDSRGKSPGIRGRDGLWRGFDWVPHEADATDLARWHAMGAGVGVKTGAGLVAIDADTRDVALATIIRDEIERRFGRLPVRVGQSPKALYLLRVDDETPYRRIEFGRPGPAGQRERVEILTSGRQFVAHGIHSKTGRPYDWPRGVPRHDELPVVAPGELTALLEALRALLPEARPIVSEGAVTTTSQAALRGDPDAVRRAVENIPNTSNHFPAREDYLAVGYAIKAAVPDAAEAFDIWSSWCARWRDGENDPDVMEADWRRMKPPFRRGAAWLYDLAERYGGDGWTSAHAFFDAVDPSAVTVDDNPFAGAPQPGESDLFPLVRLDELMARPPQSFLVARHVPSTSLGFLYSVPGAGKTFLALDLALSVAYRRPDWHGDTINPTRTGVLYIASEGSYGFRNRIRAWTQARDAGAPPDGFRVLEQTVDFMNAGDVDRLLRSVRASGLAETGMALIVVDTVSRAMPGADENLQKEMTLFVRACDRLKEAFRCAVLGVHHAGKNGDMRGSTVLMGAGDFVFRLERRKDRPVGHLHCEKHKDAPDGWTEPYRFNIVDVGDGESSIVPERAPVTIGPSIGVTPDLTQDVLRGMQAAWDRGEPWGARHQSGERFAERRLIADHGLTAAGAAEMLDMLLASGLVVADLVDRKSKRKGLRPAERVRGVPKSVFG